MTNNAKLNSCMTILLIMAASILGTVEGETEKSNTWSLGVADTIKDTVMNQTEAAGTLLKQFEEFMFKYGKSYSTMTEQLLRFDIFKNNLKVIDELMLHRNGGTATYAINFFADLTLDEFTEKYLTLKSSDNLRRRDSTGETDTKTKGESSGTKTKGETKSNSEPLQKSKEENAYFSWIDELGKNYPPVDDQGDCGSCYSFACCGAVEIMWSQKNKKVVKLSQQQIVDCTQYINYGCDGGLLDTTFPYIKNVGLVPESQYPYKGVNKTCKKTTKKGPFFKIESFTFVKGDQAVMMKATRRSPLTVAMNASDPKLQFYESGIIIPKVCPKAELNHAVVIVGFGTTNVDDEDVKWWLVRNSWGPAWGKKLKGHFKIKRGGCGIGKDNWEISV